jgi:hypothetical protein
VNCQPFEYLEKVGNTYTRALKKEEMFVLPPPKSIALSGVFGKKFELDKEVTLSNASVLVVSHDVYLKSKVEGNETSE